MVKIKCKGKRLDNGEWIEGYYGILGEGADLEKHVIMQSTLDIHGDRFYFTDYEVDSKTVRLIKE